MSHTRVSIVVADDHVLFRRGLVSLLTEMPEFDVVGEAGNGIEAIEIVQKTQPEIVLMDVNMPLMDGIAALQELRAANSPAKILMLTISKENDDLLGAIHAGADGYLLKNTDPDELRRAILRVTQGEGVLSPEVTSTVMRIVARHPSNEAQNVLSDRELEVLTCLADGLTTIQIANQLFISENTVKTHIRHILEKLDASNRTEAVSKAIQFGLIQKREQ
ncbi:MAG TPA: response regulator transcription factor [Anaerolineaceae bacterium]|nr:response regulator transcription factor [Anaerolineaceae bacterium]